MIASECTHHHAQSPARARLCALNLPLDLACVHSISRSISRVCSFGGGTDVAGPLRRALDVLETPVAEEVIAF